MRAGVDDATNHGHGSPASRKRKDVRKAGRGENNDGSSSGTAKRVGQAEKDGQRHDGDDGGGGSGATASPSRGKGQAKLAARIKAGAKKKAKGKMSQPTTGIALPLFLPLSDSPAYVCPSTSQETGDDEGSDCEGYGKRGAQQRREGHPTATKKLPASDPRGVDTGCGKDTQESGTTQGGKEGGVEGGGGDAQEKGRRSLSPAERGDSAAAAEAAAAAAAAATVRFHPQLALGHLKSLPLYEAQAAYTEILPGRKGEFAETARPLHPEIIAALAASKGVTR